MYRKVKGYEIVIEAGKVVRALGTKTDGQWGSLYPYRWDKTYKSWILDQTRSFEAFRAAMKRGTMKLY